MSYELVPLGELGEIVAGSTPDTNNKEYWDGDISWITPADLTKHKGIYFNGELRKITEKGYKSCSTKMLPVGSILFSSRAPIGHCAVTSFPLCTNQGFKSIIPNERLDPLYGFFALKFFTPQIEALGRGATFTEVNKEIFENYRIPVPPLTEQKRIAALLARADRLRQLRRTAHDLGDALLQSVFLEMFGNALSGKNPEMPLVPLETLCTKITDGTHVTPTYLNEGVPFLSVKNITKVRGTLDFSDIKYISPEEHKKISKLSNVERDDLLYTKIGATYGFAQIVDTDREFSIFVSVALLKPDKTKILPKYFESVMRTRFVKEQADRLVSGIGVPDLHLREIKTFQIPLPPIPLQEEFAGVVARVDGLRGRMSESTRQVDGLFESLLAEAFQ